MRQAVPINAVALHQLNALIQALAEYRRRKFLETLGQSRIAPPGLKFVRVECRRVHRSILLSTQLQVDLRLLRVLPRDSKK